MSAEECVIAVQSTLNEVKNVCPPVCSTFVFKSDGALLAKDKYTSQDALDGALEALGALNRQAKELGGFGVASFEGAVRRVTVSRVDNLYLVAVASREADEKVLNALTGVIVPTVLRLVALVNPEFVSVSPEFSVNSAVKNADVEAVESCEAERVASVDVDVGVSLPDSVGSQLIVENLAGVSRFLGAQDTVRVDSSVIARWADLYGEREIKQVEVEETRTGQKVVCRFKPIKDSASDGKGVIQLPEKVQAALQAKKGALVLVKPVIE